MKKIWFLFALIAFAALTCNCGTASAACISNCVTGIYGYVERGTVDQGTCAYFH